MGERVVKGGEDIQKKSKENAGGKKRKREEVELEVKRRKECMA